MAASTPSTILLKGEPTRYEREAAGAITPGHLLVLGSGDTVIVHGTAEGNTSKWFAVENDIAGDDLDHAYASGEKVQIHAAKTGEELYVYIAAGENIAIGDYLESAGSGQLKEWAADSAGVVEQSNAIVGMSLQTLDLSASAAVATRCKIVIT